jgi:SAM-dependent methyltransferase
MINSKEYWESRYSKGGNSGNGSYGYLANYKSDVINEFIIYNKINSLLEFGCGDGNNLSLIKCKEIHGVDVSETALKLCKEKVKGTFYQYDEFKPITVDLTLSMDVIYHLIEDEVYNDYMDKLTSNDSKHLIIYANNEDKYFAPHMMSREFTKHPLLNDRYAFKNVVANNYPFDGVKGSVSQWYYFTKK